MSLNLLAKVTVQYLNNIYVNKAGLLQWFNRQTHISEVLNWQKTILILINTGYRNMMEQGIFSNIIKLFGVNHLSNFDQRKKDQALQYEM